MTRRIQSTPEQIEAAIFDCGSGDPCRYGYAIEVWPDDDFYGWAKRVPPHAVIHALRKDRDAYHGLLQAERRRRSELAAEVVEVRRAAARLVEAAKVDDALTPSAPSLFSGEAAS